MNGKFCEKGNVYILQEKRTKFPLHNYHFNREYYMTVANDLSGESKGLEPMEKTFNRNFRYCIVKDEADVWSVGGAGENAGEPDDFLCEYRLHSTVLMAKKKDVKVSVEAFVPLQGMGEYFIYKIKNESKEKRRCSLTIVHSLEDGPMGAKCQAEMDNRLIYSHVVPYHIYYDDYAKIASKCCYSYTVASRKADRVHCSEYALFDGVRHDVRNAASAQNYPISYYGKPIAGFSYDFDLEAGEEQTVWTYTGLCVTAQEAKKQAETLLSDLSIAEKELGKTRAFFEAYTDKKWTHSGDENIDNFASFWAKKQLMCMAYTRRCSKGYGVRNALQDAMGLAFLDESSAIAYFKDVLGEQKKDGSLRQHGVWGNVYPLQGLGLLYIRDGPSWLVLCVANYVLSSGNYAFLQEKVGYKDGGEDTVLGHLLNAVAFMWKDRGMYGLSLLGDGDWTDPINGPGRKGKGVSTWTSMAFVYGVRTLICVLQNAGEVVYIENLKAMMGEMETNILSSCYVDEQFIAGYNDEGEAYGCKEDQEGNLFLNMHSWAIISGVAKGEVRDRCVELIKSLCVPFGVLVMKPPFTDWNAKFGKISVKRAGSTENGSAYCHASMFAIYALFKAGEKEFATKLMKDILPTHDYQADFDVQAPIFIPNYYFGVQSPQYGRSSGVNNTGTCAWFIKTYKEFFMDKKAGD